MKQQFYKLPQILISLCLLLIFSTPIQAEPPNLSLIRKEIKNYYDSGLYHHELERTIKLAEKYINQEYLINKNNKNPQKLAIILDIDETSLSNYEKMVKRDFTGSKEQIHKEILAANSPAIQPMLTLYKNALKRGIKVFFVTGRQESERDATRTNLINAGYTKWSGLYLRPNSYSSPSIIPFKSKTREMIEKKGYTIIASIGDQCSDIQGGYAKKGFKLPNPFYYLP
ncbi:TPA: acid phosphatase [Legionella pneumophila]|uniref:HAD family acid phosphatase n=1 Tax=Legionella pneumophila TaxID=446 RepID=UPI000789A7B5|nr:HAD family acid phosphatase [Legionella pneumophila]MDW8879367.1 HAD family acid phosphatase [Legionella pneumophila subsp. fraseri]MDW8961845.1 HAD family acid phosphatase [Legionella pneumophila subsp. fraseri]MDW9035613.1 HAD family acid phosphatase [Legionella pneumophila subsp. fraseri]MDW9039190.1 HAD family acid phosphatase [Legionella pneumophila subsp. fraseri]MDW9042038.1 HAD family acid phosphatase [Legionella pneumophila subsp. fraseri]